MRFRRTATRATAAAAALAAVLPASPAWPAAVSASAGSATPVEVPAQRTEFTTTYANPDGTHTTKISTRPVHYPTATGWAPVDMTLLPGALGVVRTAANQWSATFAPTPGGGLRVRDGATELAMAPLGAAPSVPVVGADGTSVTYRDVWPGVDLQYRLFSDEVKEEIVLHRRPDRNVFAFATGTPLVPDPEVPGGLRAAGTAGARWRVPPAEVLDNRRMPVRDQVARLDAVAGSQVRVTVDEAWLDSLTAADYPVYVDPTYQVGSSYSAAFRAFVSSCGPPCSVRVGNPDTSWQTWRSVVQFPYESLFGKQVTGAQIDIWGLSAGTISNYFMDAVHSTADNWPNFAETLVDNANGGGNYVLTSSALTSFYDNLMLTQDGGEKLKFIGEEGDPNYISYKQFDSFQLTLTWVDRAPSVDTPSASPGSVFEDQSVTVSQGWSHPTDQARLFVCRAPGANMGGCTGGTWGSSGYGSSGTAQASFVPGHSIGTQSYWTYVCTTATCSSARSGTFGVSNRPPTAGTATDGPDPVREGNRITFTVPFTDVNTGVSRATICKTASPNGGSCDAGQAWTTNSGIVSSPAASYWDVPTNTAAGTYTYFVYACDGDGGCSTVQSGTFVVQDAAQGDSVTDTPDPVHVGNAITFSASWSGSTEANKAVVCKTNAITQGTGACPGGQWATGLLSATSPSTASYTAAAADVGSRNYWAFLCTSANACATTGLAGSFLVQDPPVVTTASDSPDPADPGTPVTFTVGWNSSVETVKAVICKTNAITQGSATCPGGLWASGTAGASSPATATFTPTAAHSGTQNYYAFACTAGGACSSNSVGSTFRITSVPAESVTAEPAVQARAVGDDAVATVTARDVNGNAAPNAPVLVSRAGANPQTAQSFTANASGVYVYRYQGANPGVDTVEVSTGVGRPTARVTVVWAVDADTAAYPSGTCTAGGNVVSGHLGDTYTHVRQDADPLNPNARRICVVAQNGATHLGGQLVVTAGSGSVSPDVGVDTSQAAAASCLPIGWRVQGGFVAGSAFAVDVATNPNGESGAWVCVEVAGLYLRLRVAAGTAVTANFLPDQAVPTAYAQQALTGTHSKSCQANGGTRYLNLLVGTDTPVALYTWSESSTKAYVCVRSGFAGGRLAVDSAALPGVELGDQKDASTPWPLFDNGTVRVWTVDPAAPTMPAGVFVDVAGIKQRITVTGGAGSLVAFHQDPA